ncbi:hypothetical protein DFA_09683 [Cavenderia fasciculata]|uniref:BLOC-1-related complex subunit 8 homolog n=1 Tax=Cavenderia fasciculata TaxID=261658 RepID=F4Q8B1_CACFS|nr:uncharacterized protein DFA_09683 [Cavenderia fasciculata]EGG16011.1 hypothetical protein DFA_09683 [Cavenderia fasciculata]|eukprot:XP_004352336.1 hypothetical protein DFA_09683 [Cavenderia fasciculata]
MTTIQPQIQQQQQQQQQPQQVLLTLDANTAESILKSNKKISDYIHHLANEPSVGMYHVQEHIRKAVPKNVTLKKEVKNLTSHIEDISYNVDDSIKAIQSINEITTFNHIHELLVSSIDRASKLVNNKSLAYVNSQQKDSSASRTFSSFSKLSVNDPSYRAPNNNGGSGGVGGNNTTGSTSSSNSSSTQSYQSFPLYHSLNNSNTVITKNNNLNNNNNNNNLTQNINIVNNQQQPTNNSQQQSFNQSFSQSLSSYDDNDINEYNRQQQEIMNQQDNNFNEIPITSDFSTSTTSTTSTSTTSTSQSSVNYGKKKTSKSKKPTSSSSTTTKKKETRDIDFKQF